jgi:hypothetical protein
MEWHYSFSNIGSRWGVAVALTRTVRAAKRLQRPKRRLYKAARRQVVSSTVALNQRLATRPMITARPVLRHHLRPARVQHRLVQL